MKKNNDIFSASLQSFFLDYLPKERGYSSHTIRAYRDTFVLLFEFYDDVHGVDPDKITVESISRSSIAAFLEWLESKKGNSVRTRNLRRAAICSFCKYMMYEDPTHIDIWKSIRSIPIKRGIKDTVNYLSVEGMTLLLNQIEKGTRNGLRNFAMLSLLYYTGIRVQELIDLTPSSIRKEEPYGVEVMGKGKKKRFVPIMEDMRNLIEEYMEVFSLKEPHMSYHPLFFNSWGEKLTNPGVAYLVRKYAGKARIFNPNIIPDKISPHSFRHSRAMHLLQGGEELIYIRDMLGHVSVQTTEIYARVDSKHKREAMEKAYSSIVNFAPSQRQWDDNPKLLQILKNICK